MPMVVQQNREAIIMVVPESVADIWDMVISISEILKMVLALQSMPMVAARLPV